MPKGDIDASRTQLSRSYVNARFDLNRESSLKSTEEDGCIPI